MIALCKNQCFLNSSVFFRLKFIPCKAEQPLEGIELQEKEEEKHEKYAQKRFI